MTADQFRSLALSLDGVIESSHMGHPDFRANGKIFATLHYPDESWGMVKLSHPDQQRLVESKPEGFVPVKGSWGLQGSTNVRLQAVSPDLLEHALHLAWEQSAAPSDRKSASKNAR